MKGPRACSDQSNTALSRSYRKRQISCARHTLSWRQFPQNKRQNNSPYDSHCINHLTYSKLNGCVFTSHCWLCSSPSLAISRLYAAFDELLDVYGVHKVKTIGGEHRMLAMQTTPHILRKCFAGSYNSGPLKIRV